MFHAKHVLAISPPNWHCLFQIPKGFSVNQEIELGVIISRKGKHITEAEAMEYVGGYCAALDMTATCRMVNIQ